MPFAIPLWCSDSAVAGNGTRASRLQEMRTGDDLTSSSFAGDEGFRGEGSTGPSSAEELFDLGERSGVEDVLGSEPAFACGGGAVHG